MRVLETIVALQFQFFCPQTHTVLVLGFDQVRILLYSVFSKTCEQLHRTLQMSDRDSVTTIAYN